MVGVNVARLESLSMSRLNAECRKLSRQWAIRGYPEPDDMPAEMLIRYLALKAETERRGNQLRLF